MKKHAVGIPRVASRSEWLVARKALLLKEKDATRRSDALSAERRRLPMVRVEKDYVFDGPEGKVRLIDLFQSCRQLFVHHFMWNSEREQHCPGCTAAADVSFDNPRFREHLKTRDTAFVAISRAPLSKITPYKTQKGWSFPWYSSFGTDFNYDFHVTLDDSKAPIEYNYRNKAELIASGLSEDMLTGDWPANSIFLRAGDQVFHTYSAYTRGLDSLFSPHNFLDLTPYGRQEAWEDSPEGWPKR